MTKSIFKEIIIVLLICVAIILLWVSLLYRFNPMNKVLPDNVEYATSTNVKQALKSIGTVDADEVILTYQINQEDLVNYQRINEYKPGKTNPFSTYEQRIADDTEGEGSGEKSGSGSSSGGQKTSPSVEPVEPTDTTEPGTVNPGEYVPDRGTK